MPITLATAEEVGQVAGGDQTVAASGTISGQSYSSVTYHCDGSMTFGLTNGGTVTTPPPTDLKLRSLVISKC